MRLGKSLIGNSVFGKEDGRKLGDVKDLYIDSDLTSVVGVYLGSEGILRPSPRFVERSAIALFGIDAVLAKSPFTVYEKGEGPEPPGWIRLDRLQGREVCTPGGTKIGKLGDVVLDEDANVTGFSLVNLSVRGPVAESDAVGRSALVDVEDEEGAMTLDLAEAEQALLVVDPSLLFAGPVVPEEVEEPGMPAMSLEPAAPEEFVEPEAIEEEQTLPAPEISDQDEVGFGE